MEGVGGLRVAGQSNKRIKPMAPALFKRKGSTTATVTAFG